MEINLKNGAEAPFKRPYPITQVYDEAVKQWLQKNLDSGMIRRSTSPASSPIIVVKKPGGGLRVCTDYRALNALTIKNRYPMPLVRKILGRINGKKFFTKLDIIVAFNRMRVREGDE